MTSTEASVNAQEARDRLHERLTQQAKNQVCMRCNSQPRVATLEGEYRLRCNCLDREGNPANPVLGPKPDPMAVELAKRLPDLTSQNPEIRDLTTQAVKEFLCPDADDAELVVFVRLCKALGLNPFVRDCYLVKYAKDKAAQIIIGVQAHRKWALHDERFDTVDSGIIVRPVDGGSIEFRAGTYIDPFGELLGGGWCDVHLKTTDEVVRHTVAIHEYLKVRPAYNDRQSEPELKAAWSLVPVDPKLKEHHIAAKRVPQSTWGEIPATMIDKVATCQGLAHSFPEDVTWRFGQAQTIAAESHLVVTAEDNPALEEGEVVNPGTGEISKSALPAAAGTVDDSPHPSPAQWRMLHALAKEKHGWDHDAMVKDLRSRGLSPHDMTPAEISLVIEEWEKLPARAG